jgi:hypothetical protein
MVNGKFSKIGHNVPCHVEEVNHLDKECAYHQEMEVNHVMEKKLKKKIVMNNLVMNYRRVKKVITKTYQQLLEWIKFQLVHKDTRNVLLKKVIWKFNSNKLEIDQLQEFQLDLF